VTIIFARFMPFFRTSAPFVAGVAEMMRSKFMACNVIGARSLETNWQGVSQR
jgi:membrane-associated protein